MIEEKLQPAEEELRGDDVQIQRKMAEAEGVMNDQDGAYAFPPLWIDKCLYTPTLVVRAVIAAAGIAAALLAESGTRNERDGVLVGA